MPPHQSAVSVLIQEVLSDPDLAHDDVFRRLLQAGLQDLIDAEATAEIGAGPYERSSERSNRRNGKRSKKLATTAGEVDLAIPKLQQGSYFGVCGVFRAGDFLFSHPKNITHSRSPAREAESFPHELSALSSNNLSCTGWGGLCFRVGFFVGMVGVGWSFRGTKAAVGSGG